LDNQATLTHGLFSAIHFATHQTALESDASYPFVQSKVLTLLSLEQLPLH
jgi:hypothetical protein